MLCFSSFSFQIPFPHFIAFFCLPFFPLLPFPLFALRFSSFYYFPSLSAFQIFCITSFHENGASTHNYVFSYFKLAKLENWSIIWLSYLFLSIMPRQTQIYTRTNTLSHTHTHVIADTLKHAHSLFTQTLRLCTHTHTHSLSISHGGSPN